MYANAAHLLAPDEMNPYFFMKLTHILTSYFRHLLFIFSYLILKHLFPVLVFANWFVKNNIDETEMHAIVF